MHLILEMGKAAGHNSIWMNEESGRQRGRCVMKRGKKWLLLGCLFLVCMLLPGTMAEAADSDTIKNGIYADNIELSGMSAGEAGN